MTSRPAIDPAISTLPVMNQLIAKVSSVPRVRQLTALRTDLECVSAPRNEPTRDAPCSTTPEPNTLACSVFPPHVLHNTTVGLYIAQRTPTNYLIELNNSDSAATASMSDRFPEQTRLTLRRTGSKAGSLATAPAAIPEPNERSVCSDFSDNIQQLFSRRPAQSEFGKWQTSHIYSEQAVFYAKVVS
jgi:hypothetical protein